MNTFGVGQQSRPPWSSVPPGAAQIVLSFSEASRERGRRERRQIRVEERGGKTEETDFGQSNFGHPDLARPILANLFLANPILDLVCVMVGPRSVSGPRRVGSRKGPKFRFFFCFSLSRLHFRSFCLSLSLWVSSCGILVVLKRRDPQMCTFGVLGLSCGAFVT